MPAANPAPSSFPLSQFVLKVHGRCDLACDHCYVYEHADQSWRLKDIAISDETVAVAAERIAAHAKRHGLQAVRVVLHGGEPLLLSPARLRAILGCLRSAIEPSAKLRLYMQTNAVRLNESYADVLLDYQVRIGVSLDGDRLANDRHRRFANGGSSYDKVVAALALLRRPAYASLYAGILCTIDIRNDPVAVYESLLEQRPPRVDFLLPHATWDSPPPRYDARTPYADWLGKIYLRWRQDGQPMRVRLFESLLSTAAGGPTGSEQIGIGPADILVIETDGSWEQADSLKTAFDGGPETGMSVYQHSVDEVAAHPEVTRRQLGLAGLSKQCQECPLVRQCGGGLYAHRYRSGSGFDNPSVYCDDLKELVRVVNTNVAVLTHGMTEAETPVPGDLISQVGSGLGDADVLKFLCGTQLDITRALVRGVADDLGSHEMANEAWLLLQEADRLAPHATDEVLAHPYVRAWAVKALQQKDSGQRDFGYLSAIALAVALRAGMDAELALAITSERLYLPGLGTALLPGASGPSRASVENGRLTVRGVTGDRWLPVASLQAGDIEVSLDNADPYRDCHKWPPVNDLSPSEVDNWRQTFAQAWESIGTDAPEQLPGLRAGLRTLVPLQADPDGLMRASTARHAFGAVAAALADPDALAVMIVHEFQHGKLGALLDLVDLFDPAAKQLFSVGWRPDPRPVEGALQGTYAHLAVARMWHTRAVRGGPQQERATIGFKQYYHWTEDALLSLRDSSVLTPAGQELVGHMAASLALVAP
ncbi:FxsB family cyclophane-forming radical SAM/SPASM peptide maturase [Catelliglobosispora koreensis]|uniref:FxsB family cyclophane-forming radical SAM/SPASM peptide maturase n=1 Tax=Catelliglobosispora koreensis TaxID=129052 RepID=UPI0003630DE9|nr:FxsB family cyclophane-forming radical SAM/SPASM peptide maturase [Catelliglobosispora koreensis]